MYHVEIDISWRSVIPFFHLQWLPLHSECNRKLSCMNQRNQELRCLERRAVFFYNASATFPCFFIAPLRERRCWRRAVVLSSLLAGCVHRHTSEGICQIGFFLGVAQSLTNDMVWTDGVVSLQVNSVRVDSTYTSYSRFRPLTKIRAKVNILRALTRFSILIFLKATMLFYYYYYF